MGFKNKWFYKSPLEGFSVANTDENAGIPKYYGYENMFGEWIIMRESPSETFEYCYGHSGYAAAWIGRAGLVYAAPSVTFAILKS